LLHNELPLKPIRNKPLPVEQPGVLGVDEEEIEAVTRVLRRKELFRYSVERDDSEVATFESEFAEYIEVKHALAVTSGTAALGLALQAMGAGPGKEIIIPAYHWISVFSAVVNLGAIPVLADIDDTFALDPSDVARKITARTAGIIAVHMNGGPANLHALLQLSRKHGLFLLEDCAQSLGATYDGRSVGSFGDMAIFSFQANKNVSSGEGGAIVSNSSELIRRATATHDLGIPRDNQGMLQQDAAAIGWGWGVRMDELRAAVLRVQLRRLVVTLSRMRNSHQRLTDALSERRGVALRRMPNGGSETGGFLLTTFETETVARQVNRRMRELGIQGPRPETSNVLLADYGYHIYSAIPTLEGRTGMPASSPSKILAERPSPRFEYVAGTCPVADDLFARTQLLTISPTLTLDDERDILQGFIVAMEREGL
jgi:dTDP-4-amino-4,6-dideoxygalactose transaminase